MTLCFIIIPVFFLWVNTFFWPGPALLLSSHHSSIFTFTLQVLLPVESGLKKNDGDNGLHHRFQPEWLRWAPVGQPPRFPFSETNRYTSVRRRFLFRNRLDRYRRLHECYTGSPGKNPVIMKSLWVSLVFLKKYLFHSPFPFVKCCIEDYHNRFESDQVNVNLPANDLNSILIQGKK